MTTKMKNNYLNIVEFRNLEITIKFRNKILERYSYFKSFLIDVYGFNKIEENSVENKDDIGSGARTVN